MGFKPSRAILSIFLCMEKFCHMIVECDAKWAYETDKSSKRKTYCFPSLFRRCLNPFCTSKSRTGLLSLSNRSARGWTKEIPTSTGSKAERIDDALRTASGEVYHWTLTALNYWYECYAH